MKIENFQLKMQSKYMHETSVSASFDGELQTQEAIRSSKISRAMELEKRFSEEIKLLLVRELLGQLEGNFCKTDFPTDSLNSTQEQNPLIHVTTQDSQKLDLNMGGFIQTDTQKIAIDVSVSISHTLITQRSFEASHCIDPLIINLDGEMPSLCEDTFHFDIDNDGESDQISMLGGGNGFLALDRDENGTIDQGSELFGTTLGNGFAELSLFDSDNNMWIDENDPILDKLRIWVKNGEQDELLALGEVGIGAIYLGSTRSEFSYKSEERNLGELRSNGLFLYENGQSGIISQIDLAKQSAKSIPKSEPLANLIMQS
jgi:hypothetical protein